MLSFLDANPVISGPYLLDYFVQEIEIDLSRLFI